jgi:menaquinone-dependent protoporphyrinogen IX oxidase
VSDAENAPRVLLVYYSFTGQVDRVASVLAETFAATGWTVSVAQIEITDARYASRFSSFPMRRPIPEIVGMLPAQLRRTIGEIHIPPEGQHGKYDLVVVGSPTWWLTTSLPIRSYLESPAARRVLEHTRFAAFSVSRRYWRGNLKAMRALGERAGGTWVAETHFTAAGGQVGSMLSWLAYMKRGAPQVRVLGIGVPPPNLRVGFSADAQAFANELVNVVGHPARRAARR